MYLSKKAQLVTVYLLVFVVLLLAFFAVVRVGKLNLVRTRAANSADAAALAAASVMANALNATAVTSRDLIVRYKDFQELIEGASSDAVWDPLIDRMVQAAGSCNCYTAAYYHRMLANLIVSTEYIIFLYTMRQLDLTASAAKNLQDAWVRSRNIALELGLVNSGLFSNLAPQGRMQMVDRWFNKVSYDDDFLPYDNRRKVTSYMKCDDGYTYTFHDPSFFTNKQKHNIGIKVSVQKRKLTTVEATIKLHEVVQGMQQINETWLRLYNVVTHGCLACAAMHCDSGCHGVLGSTVRRVAMWTKALFVMYFNKRLIIPRSRTIDDNATVGNPEYRCASGGGFSNQAIYSILMLRRFGGITALLRTRQGGDASTLSLTASAARDRAPFALRQPPTGTTFWAMRYYLDSPFQMVLFNPFLSKDVPIEFYLQDDVGDLDYYPMMARTVRVETTFSEPPVLENNTFWTGESASGEKKHITFKSVAEASYNYNNSGTILPPGVSFRVGLVRTDKLNKEGGTDEP